MRGTHFNTMLDAGFNVRQTVNIFATLLDSDRADSRAVGCGAGSIAG